MKSKYIYLIMMKYYYIYFRFDNRKDIKVLLISKNIFKLLIIVEIN